MDKYEILNIIRSAIIEVSPYAAELMAIRSSGTQNVYLVDLGINSIDYAQIVLIVMNKLEIDFPIDVFSRTNSINEVVDIFYDLASCAA